MKTSTSSQTDRARVAVGSSVRPALRAHEILLVAALAILAGLSLLGQDAAWIIPLHLALVAGILAGVKFDRPGLPCLLRKVAPVAVCIPLLYSETPYIVPGVTDYADFRFDAVLRGIERAAFGDVAGWAGSMSPLLADALTLGYWSYYLWPVLLVARAYRRPKPLREVITILTAVALVSFVGYYVVPALGPYAFEARPASLDGVLWAGPAHRIMAQAEGHNPAAFPSGHTMISLAVLVLCFRHDRRLFWWMLPFEVLLLSATWMLRYHYVPDILAGLCLMPPAVWAGLLMSRRPWRDPCVRGFEPVAALGLENSNG